MLYNCQDRAIIRYRSQLWKFSLYDNDSRNMSFSRNYDVNVIDRSSKRLDDALPCTQCKTKGGEDRLQHFIHCSILLRRQSITVVKYSHQDC